MTVLCVHNTVLLFKGFIMNRVILSPAKYVQGPHVLNELASLVMPLGNKALVIIDKTINEKVSIDFSDNVFKKIELFSGECCYEEIERLGLLVKEQSIDVVIGVGGGKVIDSAKAIGHLQNIAVVVCPTAASSDAPTSALSVVYQPSGEFLEYFPLRKNPDLVVVDSEVIAKAPTRLLVAGIGDALATYFEARVNYENQRITMAGGIPSLSAFTLAKLAYETLLKYALDAKRSVDNNEVTLALENIIEANTYLSGIGFESSGLAAAHAIHNGFSQLNECHHLLHGEKVAFGTIVQLVLEKSDINELKAIIKFCRELGLPTTLKEMGISKVELAQLNAVADAACEASETIHNMPFTIKPSDLVQAIIRANEISSKLV